jgi:hypothetical protein
MRLHRIHRARHAGPRPLAPWVEFVNWQGDVIASSMGGRLESALPMPGAYSLFVDSPTGQFSDGRPYRLVVGMAYANGASPRVLFANEFHGSARGDCEYSNARFICSEANGRYTIESDQGSTPSGSGWSTWRREVSHVGAGILSWSRG